jgi:hypothetical protein
MRDTRSPLRLARTTVGAESRPTLSAGRSAEVDASVIDPAVQEFAVAAFQAARKRYRHEDRYWQELPDDEQQVWIEMAVEWLQEVEPPKCSYGCGRYRERGSDFCSDQCRISSERG